MSRGHALAVGVAEFGSYVTCVAWPAEAVRAACLAAAGAPHLLLVDPDAAPPAAVDVLRDWVRLPADAAEVRARARRLARLAAGTAR